MTVTDASNNVTTCSFTVTVNDTEAPVITGTPSNITLSTGSRTTCNQVATWTAPTATDNCSGTVSVSSNYSSGNTFPVGTTTVTYTFTDVAGNSSTSSFTVTVVDNTAPVIADCPQNITIYSQSANSASCTQIGSWTVPTATDNCAISSMTANYNPGYAFPVGSTMVTYTAVDIHGNMATSSFMVTVIDNTIPQFTTCPSPVVNAAVNTAGCMAAVAMTTPVYSDNCGVTQLTWTMTGATTASSAGTGINTISSPYSFNVGTTTVTYVATDAAGNAATCTFTVSVVNTLQASISGTATVAVNSSAPSITFTGTGGTKPYTFTYTVNGGSPQTVTTVGTNASTSVPQSTATPGDFIYTLVSVTDNYGCYGTLATDTKDTITVLTTIPRPELYSSVDQPLNSTFAVGYLQEGYVSISNVSTDPTTGEVTFSISKPVNFTLEIPANMTVSQGDGVNNADWNITSLPGVYVLRSKAGVVIPANGSSKIGFKLTAAGGPGSRYITTISINNGTGGSSNVNGDSDNSNNQSVNLFIIN